MHTVVSLETATSSNNKATVMDIALRYLRSGLSVIPVAGKAKRPLIKWTPYQHRRPTEKEVRYWWSRLPQAGVGIVTGKVSGIVVVDFDSEEAIRFAREKGLLDTVVVKTGRGLHAYYRYPENKQVGNLVNIMGMKIDIRGDNGYVIAPPTVHPNGQRYQFLQGKAIGEISLRELPEIFLTAGSNGNGARLTPLKDLYKGVGEGERNNSLARLVGSWLNDGLSYEECLRMALLWNSQNVPPMEESEVERTTLSIWRKHKKTTKISEKFLYDKNVFLLPIFTYNKSLIHKNQTITVEIKSETYIKTWKVYSTAEYGLAGAFDESVFMAVCKIAYDSGLPIKNPVKIPSLSYITRMLRIQEGKNRQLVRESLERIKSLLLVSDHTFFDNQRQRTIKDMFNIWNRVLYQGDLLPDGRTSEHIYVWFNDLFINNLNSGFFAVLDFDVYTSLNNPLARGIYRVISPMLHAGRGLPAKIKYSTLQQRLQFSPQKMNSLVQKQLHNAHTELIEKSVVSRIEFSDHNNPTIVYFP